MKMTAHDGDRERGREHDRSIARQGRPAGRAPRHPGGRTAAWLAALAFGLGLGVGSTALAQPRRGGDAPAERRDGGGPGQAERREQIKKKIRAMRAYTLTETLALDEPTAGRLFPMLARYDDETDKLLEKRVDIQRRLRHADSLKDPRAVERLIDEAIAIQRGFWDLEDKRVADLRKILAPGQTAKLLVVLPALERKIQNQLRKAIVQRRGAGGVGSSGSGGGSIDDADDDQEPDEIPPPPKGPPRRREAPMAPRPGPSNAPGNTPPCNPNTEPCR
jgi:hypothetical protein